MITRYINRREKNQVETIDEFTQKPGQKYSEFMKHVREMRNEYNFADRSATYYISSRSTKEWRE